MFTFVRTMNPDYTYIVRQLTEILDERESSAVAKHLLTEVFGLSTLSLYTDRESKLTGTDRQRLEEMVERLKRHEPLQYIVGRVEFMGVTLEVNPHVLIPRPETAELVEWITTDYEGREPQVLDIGTGSGCIPIALAHGLPKAEIHAWDISMEALETARRNAVGNGVKVDFQQVDMLAHPTSPLCFDVVVSNPPYITHEERAEMEPNVLNWEPHLALFAPNNDALIFYRHIADFAKNHLKSGGRLYFEINRQYAGAVERMLEEKGFTEIETRKDLSGNDRMTRATRP